MTDWHIQGIYGEPPFYAQLYPCISLVSRGKLLDWWIFKYYNGAHFKTPYGGNSGMIVTKVWYSEQPRTGEQQGWRSVFYDAVKNWQGFDEETRRYYNALRGPGVMSGYNRYLRMYLQANYPMIIYWDKLGKNATDPVTIPDYIAGPTFMGGLDSRYVNVTGDTMTGALTISATSGNVLVVDTDVLVVDATNDRVGIGTTGPVAKLDIFSELGDVDWWNGGAVLKVKGTSSYNRNHPALQGEIGNYYNGSRGEWSPVTGLDFNVLNQVGQNVYTATGVNIAVGPNTQNATITDLSCFKGSLQISDNTGQAVTNWYGVRLGIINFMSGKTVTISNTYGFHFPDLSWFRTAGYTFTNVYGVYVEDAIAKNYFAGSVGIGTTSPTNLLSLGGNSARTFWMERHTTANTAGNSLTVQAGGATSGATDKAGGDLILQPGVSTGSAESGVQVKGCVAGASGTADRTLTNAIQVLGNKIGFFAATPVVKQAYTAVSNPPTQAEVTAIRDALVNLGLMASS